MPDKAGWYWLQFTPDTRVTMAYVWTFPNEPVLFRDMSGGDRSVTRLAQDYPDARWQFLQRPDTLYGEQASEGGAG